jgi:hypothetical protein
MATTSGQTGKFRNVPDLRPGDLVHPWRHGRRSVLHLRAARHLRLREPQPDRGVRTRCGRGTLHRDRRLERRPDDGGQGADGKLPIDNRRRGHARASATSADMSTCGSPLDHRLAMRAASPKGAIMSTFRASKTAFSLFQTLLPLALILGVLASALLTRPASSRGPSPRLLSTSHRLCHPLRPVRSQYRDRRRVCARNSSDRRAEIDGHANPMHSRS